MAKAVISKDDCTITIEGTEDEVFSLVRRFENGEQSIGGTVGRRRKASGTSRTTPTELVCEMIDEGFFSTPKELGAVRSALEEVGHFYPVTTLSPLMLRLVRNKKLRRIKDKKRWKYVT